MVRKTTRRDKRVLVIDFTFTKPDGTEGRYRRDAAVQTMAAAQTEETARKLGATLFGDPERMCGANGVPLRLIDATPEPQPPREPTFREVAERYLTEYAPSAVTPSTLDGQRSKLRAYLLPHLGDLPVSEAFEVARSREIDVTLVQRGSAASTRANTFLTLRSVAKFAVEAKILRETPKHMPLPKRGTHVPSAPSAQDVGMLIEAAANPSHRLVFLLAAHAGLRKGEIQALRCGDVELDQGRLVVRRSRYRKHLKTTKSGDERQVPITPQLRAALIEARVQERPREEEAALTSKGKPWSYNGPYYAFQKTLRRLKLPRERLHGLRAFFVTVLLSGHVPVHVVRELAGHKDLATTQGYAAILPTDRGAAVGVLDRLFQSTRDERAAEAGGGGALATRARPKRRFSHARARRSLLRTRVLARRRRRGNKPETPRNGA